MQDESRFEPNPENEKALKALMAHVAHMKRGDVVTMEMIEAIAGVERYAPRWGLVIHKFYRTMLNERGIELVNVRNVGYMLAKPRTQIVDRPAWRFQRAVRQINRGIRSLSRIQDSDLTDHQRVIRAKLLSTNKAAKAEIKRKMREQKAVFERPAASAYTARRAAVEHARRSALA